MHHNTTTALRPDLGLDLTRVRDVRSGRVSSWDQRGRNQDFWVIGPGEARAIADLEGPGAIRHIWTTQFCRRPLGPAFVDPLDTAGAAPVLEIHNALGLSWEEPDPDYYRKVLLSITYDDDRQPAAMVPLGDFFGVGHSLPANYASAFFTVSAKPDEALRFGGSAALNCYLPMPFRRRILMQIINQNDLPFSMYFHVDYELYRTDLTDDIGYLHAGWHRENPCAGWGPDLQVNSPEANIPNLDGANNYVVLDTHGSGQYVGCNLSVYHRQGSWWGEGDDMIFIDDDTWPPSVHGTGTEDYFNHAWGMQRNAYPYHGAILHEGDVPPYSVSYRFHVVDPVHFSKRIRVTIEHGHANHLSDDWASTAYWYQLPPTAPATILPVDQRLPTRSPSIPQPRASSPPASVVEEIARNRQAYEERRRTYLDRHAQRTAECIARSLVQDQANREAAHRLRELFR